MRHFGHQPLTGAQVQWGLEHLSLTPAWLKELGAEGLLPPFTLSCRDHEGGGGVQFQQWDGTQWNGDHRLDRHGSGAGAAPGGGVSGQVCAGEGHHAAGLPVGAWSREVKKPRRSLLSVFADPPSHPLRVDFPQTMPHTHA